MKEFKKGFLNGVKLLVLLGLVIGLAGCEDPNVQEPATIVGTWTSTYGEKFEITKTVVTYTGTEYEGKTYRLSGTIVSPLENLYNSAHGYIILKVTSEVDSYEYSDRTGNYVAIHWKDLTTSTIKLANASNYGFPVENPGKTYATTLEEAQTEFTTDNGYYAIYGDYTK